MKQVYLIWAILGAVVPIMFFLGVFHPDLVGVAGFVPALFANSAAGGFSADLLITSGVFWTYMFAARQGPKPWVFIALNMCIGLSCALPAYLYRREALRSE
jgi:hypothetical protein